VPTAKADHYLHADAGLGPVIAKAQELRILVRTCRDALPPQIANGLGAVNLRGDELCLLATSPASAAKLKLVAERLRKFLLQQGRKVNSVSVRVQPTRSQHAPSPAPKSISLSEAGKAEVSAL
jgi:hypothetical protein